MRSSFAGLSLDVRGRIPATERVIAFLNDTDPNKRAKLIDEFLADRNTANTSPSSGITAWSRSTTTIACVLTDNKLQEWLTKQFNKNHGWDKMVSDILTAKGDRDKNPATTFLFSNVEDAKQGQPEPNKVTAAASQTVPRRPPGMLPSATIIRSTR